MKKHSLSKLLVLLGLVVALSGLRAAGKDASSCPVCAFGTRAVAGQTAPAAKTVTFLGVETAPVPPELTDQLGLQNNEGLVIASVLPGSPAAGVLQRHDVLLKLDDQMLVDLRQLAVLVRNHTPGDEITLTFLRGGKEKTGKVKLGRHELPPLADEDQAELWRDWRGPTGMTREETGRMLAMTRRAMGAPLRPGFGSDFAGRRNPGGNGRITALNADNSDIVYSDAKGSLELKVTHGEKMLTAKDAKGATLFQGPVNTPEERRKLPGDLPARLDRISMVECSGCRPTTASSRPAPDASAGHAVNM